MRKIIIVPTPIGNLEDITLRSIRALKECDLILAEDTRNTGILLKHFGISTKMIAYHEHNEHKKTASLLEQIGDGKSYALVTDSGTPGISDPGFLMVREAVKRGIAIECLPGPSAFIPALVASGLPCDRFFFEGFLPHKKGRGQRLKQLGNRQETMVIYESPHRLLKTLSQLKEILGNDRPAVVAREISKIHEEFSRGTLETLEKEYSKRIIKGEFILVIQGKD